MKRLQFLLFLVMAVTCGSMAQTSDDEKYEQADKYYDAKEYDKAIPLLNELAQRNHAKALNLLGVCYEYGEGVTKDLSKSFDYYQKAANLGWRRAQCNLGLCYEYGEGVAVNKEKAYFWYDKSFRQYKKLADNGDADAQLEVGKFYYAGRMRGGKDYVKSLPWFEKSANQGNSDAYNYLGLIYQYAYGVEKNVDKAYDYYIKGAEKGNCYAQRNLAWLFQDVKFREIHTSGEGDSYHQDYDFERQTEKWLRMAAQNNADYMYELATFYGDMQVLDEWQDKDPDMYLRKAAEMGSAKAQANIGSGYMFENKYTDAIKMFNLAKSNGCLTFGFFTESDAMVNVDLLIQICQYFERDGNYNFKCAEPYNDKILVTQKEKSGKEGFLLFSNKGIVIAKTPCMFKNLYYYSKHVSFQYFSDDDSTPNKGIDFINTELNIDMFNSFSRFFTLHKEFDFKHGIYNGGENIFAICKKDGKEGLLKISKKGNIISSTSFEYDYLYYSYSSDDDVPSFNFGLGTVYFLDSYVNFDILFTLFQFFKQNTEYRCMSCIYYKNSIYMSVENDNNNKYRWLRISENGTNLGATPYKDMGFYYDSSNKRFYKANGDGSILSLREMISQF